MTYKIQSFGTNDINQIEEFERKLSIDLPDEYQKFLLQYNGGKVNPDTFDFMDKTDASAVNYFCGLNLKENYKNLTYKIKVFKNRVPPNFLPIGSDPFGNLIVIGLAGNELGKIYFWDHEFESDNNQPDMSNMHLLAKSFNEFLENLYEFDEE